MMIRIRKLLCIVMAFVVPFSFAALCGFANSANVQTPTQHKGGAATVTSKDEVVYATLDNNGNTVEAYVVNILDVKKEGNFTDRGTYRSVENLTSTDKLTAEKDKISGWAGAGKFYYQGNIDHAKLPWIIDITYKLDSNPVTADNLRSKSGRLSINIKTSKAPNINSAFYDHYVLQIGVTLSTKNCADISAKGATVANSGTDKLITFTALPGKDSNSTVTADVRDFSMPGITVNAVPYNMDVELPDSGDMVGQFSRLSDGIEGLDSGVAKLKDGAKKLRDGEQLLSEGSAEIMNGLEKLNEASDMLVQGSKEIKDALVFISQSLNKSLTDSDIQKIKDTFAELEALNKILKEVPEVLDGMTATTKALYDSLKIAIDAIPDETLTPQQIAQLRESNPDSQALETLIQTYYAAQTVKSAFAAVGPAFESSNNSMAATMRLLGTEIDVLSKQFDDLLKNKDMLDRLSELKSGMQLLADNYKDFDKGLRQFTDGVSELADNYSEFDAGVADIADGTAAFSDGVAALKDGTAQLYNGTKDLPEIVENAINSMTSEYDHSDFRPVSFTSEKNTKVGSVQFVFATKPIEAASKKPAKADAEEKEPNFLQRVINLFKKIFKREDK